MRLRGLVSAAGLFLLFLATTGVRGCREEAARTFNPNRPPDTYLTAAPVESTTNSYLYHVYWNGTDPDGEVVGYFIAVTDSNVIPYPDSLVWTTRTDSIIAFKVAGTSQTLTHRFYATAVDNEGRADPSPAWVFFEAYDRFYPEPKFLESYAVGTFYGKRDTFWLDDTYALDGLRDTIPMGAELKFRWTGRDRDRFGKVLGYRFRITGDAGFTDVGTNFTQVSYRNLRSATITFSLVAIDDAGAQTDPESTRVFVSNFDPDTWFDPVFVETRGGVKINHTRLDTVAAGSTLEFTVYGVDGDGDDNKLTYSYKVVTSKACGGGSNPAYSFFDEGHPGPVYKFTYAVPCDPSENGYMRAWARCKDQYDRIDGKRAEMTFYSDLPPQVRLSAIRLDGRRLDQYDTFTTADTVTVSVSSIYDPDPGCGPGPNGMQVMTQLDKVGGGYSNASGWKTVGSSGTQLIHRGIKESGTYMLTIIGKDPGCRQGSAAKEIQINLR